VSRAHDRGVDAVTLMSTLGKPKPQVVIRRERRATRGAATQVVRAAVWRREGGRCRACQSRQRPHVHHLQYRSCGGTWTTANCVLLCRECHQDVHARILIIGGCDADSRDGLTFERRRWW
jgi:5-methylcytosine-specific restriction endonuclease McrA